MTINGLGKLMAKIEALGGNSQKALKKGVSKAAKKVQGDAKDLAPKDTGHLQNSIREKTEIKDDVVTGKVSTNVFYAPYVEFGTGLSGENSPSPPKSNMPLNYRQDWAGMDARPFLYPALMQNKDFIKKTVKDELQSEIRKLGGS